MMYVATYNRIHHLLDVQYDVTSRATTVGNALPAVAFSSHEQHTVVFTGLYPGPPGPDTRYTSLSGTKRSWLCYHRDTYNLLNFVADFLMDLSNVVLLEIRVS